MCTKIRLVIGDRQVSVGDDSCIATHLFGEHLGGALLLVTNAPAWVLADAVVAVKDHVPLMDDEARLLKESRDAFIDAASKFAGDSRAYSKAGSAYLSNTGGKSFDEWLEANPDADWRNKCSQS